MENEPIMKSWRRLRLRFPLEALGTMGVESWCLLLAFLFQCFVICLRLIVVLFMFGAWPCQFVCGVVLLLVFHGFLFFSFFFLPFFCFKGLKIWLEKRKVNGTQESWMKLDK